MTKQTREAPAVMNGSQGARYCGLSSMAFRKELPTIPHRRAGRRILIRKEALDRWLEGRDAEEAA